MCFSASASFVAATALTAVGIATLRLQLRPAERLFAAIPLLFGIQQFTEGLIWLSFQGAFPPLAPVLTLAYSLFSHVLWPMYVPFAVYAMEKVNWRRPALRATQVAGIVVGLFLLYFLVRFPVTARVLGQHIVYESPHFYLWPVMLLYLVATCFSSMLSSHPWVRLFGVLSLLTFIAAYAIHAATVVSVWCFFAALLSFVVYLHFRGTPLANRTPQSSKETKHA